MSDTLHDPTGWNEERSVYAGIAVSVQDIDAQLDEEELKLLSADNVGGRRIRSARKRLEKITPRVAQNGSIRVGSWHKNISKYIPPEHYPHQPPKRRNLLVIWRGVRNAAAQKFVAGLSEEECRRRQQMVDSEAALLDSLDDNAADNAAIGMIMEGFSAEELRAIAEREQKIPTIRKRLAEHVAEIINAAFPIPTKRQG